MNCQIPSVQYSWHPRVLPNLMRQFASAWLLMVTSQPPYSSHSSLASCQDLVSSENRYLWPFWYFEDYFNPHNVNLMIPTTHSRFCQWGREASFNSAKLRLTDINRMTTHFIFCPQIICELVNDSTYNDWVFYYFIVLWWTMCIEHLACFLNTLQIADMEVWFQFLGSGLAGWGGWHKGF